MNAGPLVRIASVVAVCALLGGCGATAGTGLTTADLAYTPVVRGTTPATPLVDPTLYPDDDADTAPSTVEGTHLQCVPYARDHSGVNLFGNATAWWDKAAGVYERGSSPMPGAVLVLNGYSRHRAHVAVVRRIVSPREIRVDHANWLDDGAIYVNDPVVDVSENNDWTQVKVWNIRSGSWGTRVYRVQGFIGPGPAGNPVVASNRRSPADDPIARQIAATGADMDAPDVDR
ncbi:MAG: CHAP domain-containing protein [Rhizomicrobium sp.]